MLYCTPKNLSQKTLMSYEQSVKLFAAYLKKDFGIDEVEQVQKVHIQKYIQHLRNRGKYSVMSNVETAKINHSERRSDYSKTISDSTIANYLRNLKVFLIICLRKKKYCQKIP
jgi:integrase/recombinase XerD